MGSMPGVIISSLIKVKTNNPVFLLDEIDKIGGNTHQGDPSSAMLEVLDPSQNSDFQDHFLGTGFDLSSIMFIATANALENIHPALLDRLEIIDISGYTVEEKLEIAKRYLVPKQIEDNGITKETISFSDKILEKLIMGHTAESGVRGLDRTIGSICRAVAYKVAIAEDAASISNVEVTDKLIEEALGPKKYEHLL